METTYLTITVESKKAHKRRKTWRTISNLSLLALAAMFFARLVLLALDLIEFQIGVAGAITAPACAVVFVTMGWMMRGWLEDYKEDCKCWKRERISERALTAGRGSTPEKPATAEKRHLNPWNPVP